jgi:hypothetical protein
MTNQAKQMRRAALMVALLTSTAAVQAIPDRWTYGDWHPDADRHLWQSGTFVLDVGTAPGHYPAISLTGDITGAGFHIRDDWAWLDVALEWRDPVFVVQSEPGTVWTDAQVAYAAVVAAWDGVGGGGSLRLIERGLPDPQTGPVASVPDAGGTALLLGFGLVGCLIARRRLV